MHTLSSPFVDKGQKKKRKKKENKRERERGDPWTRRERERWAVRSDVYGRLRLVLEG
jgi:hypothetical protein